MYFLANFDLTDVIDIINNALRGLWGHLCEFIYPMIGRMYDVFIRLGVIVKSEEFQGIYTKISLIIGIFMVFRVTFWLIELLVNPDSTKDKEKNPRKIIQKVLISVVLLAITPTIFKYAIDLQNLIIEKSIIEQIILPSGGENVDYGSEGGKLSAELFKNFYTINSDYKVETDTEEDNDKKRQEECLDYVYNNNEEPGFHYEDLAKGYSFNLTNYCLSKTDTMSNGNEDYIINFNGIFATFVGIITLWMIIMYCISLGARYIQLIFLQVIAPVPIMCYLVPGKDNMFDKWLKQCTTTYIDAFIRVAIISFVILLSEKILANENGLFSAILNDAARSNVQIFAVLGLLTFAKKAPELIQELLPKSVTKASGDFGLSLKKRTDGMLGGKFMYGTVKRAPGYVAGGIVGGAVGGILGAAGGKGLGSRLAGGLSGAARGFSTGSKKGNVIKNISEVKKNQAAQTSRLQQWRIAAGKAEDEPNTLGDYMSRKSSAMKKAMGFETRAEELKRDTEFANKAVDSYKSVIDFGSGKALEKNKQLKAYGVNRGIAELDAYQKRAVAEYQSTNIASLLTTEDGKLKLKNINREMYLEKQKSAYQSTRKEEIYNELVANKVDKDKAEKIAEKQAKQDAENYISTNQSILEKDFEEQYNKRSDAEKYSLSEGEAAVEYLSKKAIEAGQTYDDYKKQAGFLHLVEEYAKGKDQNLENEFEVINSFLRTHPEIVEKFGIEEFKKENMDELRKKAETGDIEAQIEFEDLFKSFDMFKTLKSHYVAKNTDKQTLRDKANDAYNGGKK